MKFRAYIKSFLRSYFRWLPVYRSRNNCIFRAISLDRWTVHVLGSITNNGSQLTCVSCVGMLSLFTKNNLPGKTSIPFQPTNDPFDVVQRRFVLLLQTCTKERLFWFPFHVSVILDIRAFFSGIWTNPRILKSFHRFSNCFMSTYVQQKSLKDKLQIKRHSLAANNRNAIAVKFFSIASVFYTRWKMPIKSPKIEQGNTILCRFPFTRSYNFLHPFWQQEATCRCCRLLARFVLQPAHVK